MRTTINIYRQLGKYLEAVDAEAQAAGLGPEDPTIDQDFRTGVYLGVGLSNLLLSMMPGRLLALVELFGYKGDRQAGLQYLYRAGGWSKNSEKPSVDVGASSHGALTRVVHPLQQTTRESGGRSATWLCSSSTW